MSVMDYFKKDQTGLRGLRTYFFEEIPGIC